jgi:3-methyladenine DNA glycosylase AlkD
MEPLDPAQVAADIRAGIQALPVRNTASVRAVRRHYSKELKAVDPDFIFDLARELMKRDNQRWLAYELVRNHKQAFAVVGEAKLVEFGRGMSSWDAVDTFARTLSGPAWLAEQVGDEVILGWATAKDLWWRRAALVSTVALNVRSQGGYGDTTRTLAVCRLLVDDHEDMVVKALSWALRELAVHDSAAVDAFLNQHEEKLAARIKREVRNKLATGLKNLSSNKSQSIKSKS